MLYNRLHLVVQSSIFTTMKRNRIQVILDNDTLEQFKKEAKSQSRTESALARKYITDGIKSDRKENKDK